MYGLIAVSGSGTEKSHVNEARDFIQQIRSGLNSLRQKRYIFQVTKASVGIIATLGNESRASRLMSSSFG